MFSIIYDTWKQGGFVLIPIMGVGFWGFCLLLFTYAKVGAGLWQIDLNPAVDRIRALLAKGDLEGARRLARETPELLSYGLTLALDNRSLPESALRNLLSEKLALALYNLERHIPLVRVMAGAAPLLGLLGT